MKVSFFIDRPVFSAVISIVIVIVGIIGLTMLPVDQYPQITPPGCRGNSKPYKAGGKPFACGSHSEWYFGRKAGSQPADDNLFDFQ